jgi:hypothetical protein
MPATATRTLPADGNYRSAGRLPSWRLVLIAVEDLSHGGGCARTGAPLGTVMSRLSHGRERLRHYMNREVSGDRRRRGASLTRIK